MTAMKNKKIKSGTLLQIAGILIVLSAILLTVYNYCDENRGAKAAEEALSQLEIAVPLTSEEVGEEVIPDYILNPEMDMPSEEINGYNYVGRLDIPALELSLPIIDEWSYPALKISPCCYTGSVYTDNMVIAGHNYKRHFGRLKSLSPGDEITFTDIDGNVFYYTVSETEVLQPTAIETMVTGDWDLTLFTCTLGGKTRVTVRCEREK